MSFIRVYPRTGGGNGYTGRQGGVGYGLSPHGRGKRGGGSGRRFLFRSIPARAGETQPEPADGDGERVYPRTGGGNIKSSSWIRLANGLSPHGRGKRIHRTAGVGSRGSIPARAGETGLYIGCGANQRVYPRTGGGNVPPRLLHSAQQGLSPHGRGKPGRQPSAVR